jgi:uncharacterized phiE125 gp8 family phage protein
MISKRQVTAPETEPITLGEAKHHLYLDESPETAHPDDDLITAFIVACREWAEGFQNRAYITQTWDMYLEGFPHRGHRSIDIPLPPLQHLISLTYNDGSTNQVISFLDPSGSPIMETADFIVDESTEPGRLCLKPGRSWPAAVHQAKSVQIRFVAGYGEAADVPERFKAAMKLKLTDLYENRGEMEPGSNYEKAARSLLWMKRIVPI